MIKDSIFRPIYRRREKRMHTGFDYKGQILKKTLSSQMFGVSELFDTYLVKIESVVYEWVEAVKQIKIHANPAVDKYEDKLN
jgi:hypothetical protein